MVSVCVHVLQCKMTTYYMSMIMGFVNILFDKLHVKHVRGRYKKKHTQTKPCFFCITPPQDSTMIHNLHNINNFIKKKIAFTAVEIIRFISLTGKVHRSRHEENFIEKLTSADFRVSLD